MNSELLDIIIKRNDDYINNLLAKKNILIENFNEDGIKEGIDEAFSTKGVLCKKYFSLIKNPNDSDEYIMEVAKLNSLLGEYEDFNLDRNLLINKVINDYCDECGVGIQVLDNVFDEVGKEIDKAIDFKMAEENKKLVLKR